MSEPEAPSTAVAVHDDARDVARPLPPMNDAEVAAAYRTARAFAEGGLFKDARSAGAAFTKILAGRDLDLSPFESMSGLHVFDGKVEAGADLHASKVRGREGYDFRVAWLKIVKAAAKADEPPEVEAVWADEEDLADLRETYGCAILFTVDDKPRGVSRFTLADAETAKLAKKDNHAKYPRNMCYARAMTNGVAWYVPEVMGGLRVYGLGEVPRDPDITDVEGSAAPDMEVDLPMAVEAIVARASTLGYAPLANRSAVAMAVDQQPAEFVEGWCANATRDLNRYAAGKAEPVDAEVVEPHPAYGAEPHPTVHLEGAAAERAAEIVDRRAAELTDERRDAMRRRANDPTEAAEVYDGQGNADRAADARAEAEQLREQAGPSPEQGALEL